jgi:hypothetical protein
VKAFCFWRLSSSRTGLEVKPFRGVRPAQQIQISAMKKISIVLLACAGFVIHTHAATNFAARVIDYNPGIGFAAGYTNTEAVLSEPSRVNPFGATDPFDPPYGKGQILSIGEGGSVTVQFDKPVHNGPHKPFNLDFIIFGNTGFIITNDFDLTTFDWIGTPATDGSLFGNNPDVTRVSVSKDGDHFYMLDAKSAPVVDGLFPTDGAGDFRTPVHPGLTAQDFAGATLDDLRSLYQGSGGGSGYDIDWADDGKKSDLPWIRYVRVEVLSGRSEIDAFVAVERHKGRK